MATRFYKEEYLIAIYDADDNLIDVCDNAKEFADKYKKTLDVANSTITRINKGKRKTFFHGDQQLRLFLIPLDPTEILELKKEEGKSICKKH